MKSTQEVRNTLPNGDVGSIGRKYRIINEFSAAEVEVES